MYVYIQEKSIRNVFKISLCMHLIFNIQTNTCLHNPIYST